MTTPPKEYIDLAHRAVACDGWRWMEGMQALILNREYGKIVGRRKYRLHGHFDSTPAMLKGDPIPDLKDPPTIGCLLHLVREVTGYPDVHAEPYLFSPDSGYEDFWNVRIGSQTVHGPTEAHALVAALEGAPGNG